VDPFWLEVTGRLSLCGYLFGMGGLLTTTVVRAVRGNSTSERGAGAQGPPSPLGARASRFFFEYIGNFGGTELGCEWGTADRRKNPQARILLDWIKDQMEQRGFPAADEEEFLEHLREAIRHEDQTTYGERGSRELLAMLPRGNTPSPPGDRPGEYGFA